MSLKCKTLPRSLRCRMKVALWLLNDARNYAIELSVCCDSINFRLKSPPQYCSLLDISKDN